MLNTTTIGTISKSLTWGDSPQFYHRPLIYVLRVYMRLMKCIRNISTDL